MTVLLDTEDDLARTLTALVAGDSKLAAALAACDRPVPLRRRAHGYAGLAAIVVSQQLSVASAAAIWGRLAAAYDPFEPATLMRARATRLAGLGLSGPKIRALKEIAKAIHSGALDVATLPQMAADDAHNALVAVHGIGPWTADIYLMFYLGHADAFAAGDLALQEAARLVYGLDARPGAKDLFALAERWRPWRGVAARLLWAYYGAVKRRNGAPVATASAPAEKVSARQSPPGAALAALSVATALTKRPAVKTPRRPAASGKHPKPRRSR